MAFILSLRNIFNPTHNQAFYENLKNYTVKRKIIFSAFTKHPPQDEIIPAIAFQRPIITISF